MRTDGINDAKSTGRTVPPLHRDRAHERMRFEAALAYSTALLGVMGATNDHNGFRVDSRVVGWGVELADRLLEALK